MPALPMFGVQTRDATRGFRIEQETRIDAPREQVFDALTHGVNDWWAYRFIEGSTVRLEPHPGGRFFESSGDNEGVLWGHVTYVKRPEVIRLDGLLGMLDRPVVSIYSYQLAERDGGTILRLSHACAGDLDPKWAAAHGAGWNELLGRFLKAWIEEHKPWSAFESKLY